MTQIRVWTTPRDDVFVLFGDRGPFRQIDEEADDVVDRSSLPADAYEITNPPIGRP